MFKLLHYHRFGVKFSARQHCWLLLVLVVVLGALLLASPAEAKVLPHLLDAEVKTAPRQDIFERVIFDTPAEPPIPRRLCRAKTKAPTTTAPEPRQPRPANPPARSASL